MNRLWYCRSRAWCSKRVSRHRVPETRHPVRRAVGRGVFWLLRLVVFVAVAVAFAPVTLVAAGTAGYGWWRGLPPRRLHAAALWCLPMVAAWLIAVAAWPVRASYPASYPAGYPAGVGPGAVWLRVCLLYTSDAADDLLC